MAGSTDSRVAQTPEGEFAASPRGPAGGRSSGRQETGAFAVSATKANTPPIPTGGRPVVHPQRSGRATVTSEALLCGNAQEDSVSAVPDHSRRARRVDSTTDGNGPGRSQADRSERPVTVRGNRAPRCDCASSRHDSMPSGLGRRLGTSVRRTATLPDDHRTGVSRPGNRAGDPSGGDPDGRTVATTASPSDAAGRAGYSYPSIGLGRRSGQARRAPGRMSAPAC